MLIGVGMDVRQHGPEPFFMAPLPSTAHKIGLEAEASSVFLIDTLGLA
jgi:hypothetical protein